MVIRNRLPSTPRLSWMEPSAIFGVTLLLCLLGSVPAAHPETDPVLPRQSIQNVLLEGPQPHFTPALLTGSRWKTECSARPRPNPLVERAPEFLTLSSEYRGGAFTLKTEMGDMGINETPNTINGVSRRGARLMLQTGNTARLETFAGTLVSETGTDGVLAGASSQFSLLADRARFKTVFLTGRQSLNPGEKNGSSGEKRGDVLGIFAAFDPIPGKLSAEAEADFSRYIANTRADAEEVSDKAYRVKLGGALANYRYSALIEHTGPQYRLIAGDGPRRDRAGVALNLGADFPVHTVDLNLSRYNDNTADNELYPRLYRYEAVLGYSFRGVAALPLGLQYRKSFVSSSNEPEGVLPREAESDAVTGKVNYLTRKWDLGVRLDYRQRIDRLKDIKEMAATTVGFSPTFTSGNLAVAPDLSLSRSKDFLADLQKDTYAVSLNVHGVLLRKLLAYEMKSGYSKELYKSQLIGTETIATNFKLACDLTRIMKKPLFSSLAVKGAYNRTMAGDSAPNYALLLLLDSGKFTF